MAGWDNGEGDDLLLLFAPEGALIRGFDHESPMSPYDEDVALAGLSDSALERLSEEEERAIRDECRPLPGVLDHQATILRFTGKSFRTPRDVHGGELEDEDQE